MASRNERRRKARQRVTVTREASHDAPSSDAVGAVVIRAARRFEKAAESRQPQTQGGGEWDPEKTVPPPIPPDALWTIFETNAIHSGAINAKVADSVGRGWQLVPEDPDEEGADEDVNAVTRELTELLRGVCPKLTFTQLCQQATRELDAVGWGAWEVLRDSAGDVETDIVGILPVPAMTVRAVRNDDDVFCIRRNDKKVYFKRFGVKDHVDYETGDKSADIDEAKRANELVMFSHYSPRSPWYGIPPWVSAMPAIAEFGAIREFNVSFFESGGQADRHIHVASKDNDVAEELANDVRKQIEDSAGEAHTTLITNSDTETEVTVSSLEPKSAVTTGGRDSSFRNGKTDLKEEIRIAHQVPPGRLGIAEGGAMAGNANDSMDDDYRYGVVEPLQEIVEAELHRTIFGPEGFAEMLAGWTFEFEDKTQDDTQDEHDRAVESVDKGVMSPNDARAVKGEDKVDDPAMDAHYISGQRITGDHGAKDAATLIAELKAALEAAVGAAATGETEVEPGDDGSLIEDAPEQVSYRRFRLRRRDSNIRRAA